MSSNITEEKKKKTFLDVLLDFCEIHRPQNVYKFCKIISGDPKCETVRFQDRLYSNMDISLVKYKEIISNSERETRSFLMTFNKLICDFVSNGVKGKTGNIFCCGQYIESMFVSDNDGKESFSIAILNNGVIIIKQKVQPFLDLHTYEHNFYVIKRNKIKYVKRY